MKKLFLVALLTFSTFTSLQAKEYKDDCVVESKTVAKDAIIIDVRTKKEFTLGHPKGAINIPYFFDRDGERVLNAHFIEEVNRLTDDDYEKPLIIICRIGIRSVKAAVALADEGYEDLTNIQQGFVRGWKKAGLPIEK
ncbi:MAG: rhodanese-like domain-containing protein [Campylobacterota bacterium]|nr:rhodanese-like domain-containing protein [Campylobacterota bacterium]